MQQHMLGALSWKTAKKELVDSKLNMSHLSGKTTNGLLVASSGRRQSFPAPQQEQGHTWNTRWFWVFPYKRDRVVLRETSKESQRC